LIVIVQLLNSTRSSAIAEKTPNASCQNYISLHSTQSTATIYRYGRRLSMDFSSDRTH